MGQGLEGSVYRWRTQGGCHGPLCVIEGRGGLRVSWCPEGSLSLQPPYDTL